MNVPSPGATTKIIVRRAGGSITDGGNSLSTRVNVYPESESPRVGDEVILFLQRSAQGDTFDLVYGPYGCFKIIAGDVHAMTRQAAERRRDPPATTAAFIAELER